MDRDVNGACSAASSSTREVTFDVSEGMSMKEGVGEELTEGGGFTEGGDLQKVTISFTGKMLDVRV